MKAWHIQKNCSLKLAEIEAPNCGAKEVRVAVKAIGVNRADLLQVQGKYPAPAGFNSDIPGLEYSGIMESVGKHVQNWRAGDKVMGLIPSAAYAEFLTVHEQEILSMPPNISFAQAATIPEAFLTSYRALFLEGDLQMGQWCLVRPATAGVGLAAVQLASAIGARPIGSSRNIENLKTAQTMGLAASVVENRNLGKQLLEITKNEGVAVVMDMVGPDWNDVFKGVRTEGKLVSVGVLAGTKTELDLFSMLMHRQRISAMTMRSQPLERRIQIAKIFNDQLAPLFSVGKLAPLPLQQFDFANAPLAHKHLQEDSFSGKRVLTL